MCVLNITRKSRKQHLHNDTVTAKFSNSKCSKFEVLPEICGVIYFNSGANSKFYKNLQKTQEKCTLMREINTIPIVVLFLRNQAFQ